MPYVWMFRLVAGRLWKWGQARDREWAHGAVVDVAEQHGNVRLAREVGKGVTHAYHCRDPDDDTEDGQDTSHFVHAE